MVARRWSLPFSCLSCLARNPLLALCVLTLTAATAYTALKNGGGMIEAYGWAAVLTGFFATWISAALAVKWMVAWLNRHGLTLFAWWRFAAAALAAVLLL